MGAGGIHAEGASVARVVRPRHVADGDHGRGRGRGRGPADAGVVDLLAEPLAVGRHGLRVLGGSPPPTPLEGDLHDVDGAAAAAQRAGERRVRPEVRR